MWLRGSHTFFSKASLPSKAAYLESEISQAVPSAFGISPWCGELLLGFASCET